MGAILRPLYPTFFTLSAYVNAMMMDTIFRQADASSVTRTLSATFCLALAYLVFAPFAFAQEVETFDNQVRVKLTETAKAQFVGAEDGLPETVPQGQTGISALDQMSQRFQVDRMERVFRPAGKHEPRHIEWGLDRWYTVHYEADVDVQSVAEAYRQNAAVLESSPVYKYEKVSLTGKVGDDDESDERSRAQAPASRKQSDPGQAYIPNDPEYGSQWHYNNTESNPGTPGADIDLPEAHNIETGDSTVVISVTDGGLDLDHPDFEGMTWINSEEDINNNGTFEPTDASNGGDLNGVDDDNNGFVDDVIGYDFGDGDGVPSADGDHGTHVAGTVAAKNDNGQFGAGVAGGGLDGSGVRLMITQTFSPGGQGGFAEAITYAADNGAVVSQNSWGGGGDDPVIEDAIEYMRAEAGGPDEPMNGGIAVFAAGNDGTDDPAYPAFYPESFSVAATGPNDNKAGYSNYGSYVDISAPGGAGLPFDDDDVQSTIDGGFGPLAGTSMAAPHVSGLIGLVVSANPGMTNDEVETLLEVTGEDVNSDFEIGPRINAFNALASGGSDETPPGSIDDLAVTNSSGNSADLEWVAPGDDGDSTGAASSYDLRYSTDGPIDDSTAWANATQADGEPVPDTVGTTQSMTVTDLPFGSTVHFGIRATDEFGNTGAIGNSPSADTDPAPVLATNPDSLAAELESGQDTSVTLTVTNDGPSASTLTYSFPDFAAQALLSQPGVERNNTSPVIDDASYKKENGDPHEGIGHPVRTGAGGPDAFGYSWIDSNEPGGPSFAWNDISDVGTATGIGTEESVTVDLPFTFEFYGEEKNEVKIGDDGLLTFGEDGTDFTNDPIPDSEAPNDAIFGFWEDLDPGEGGEVYHYHDESTGNFIVQWDEVPAWGFGSTPVFTFQVVLSQDGTIRYNYLSMDTSTGDDHASASIGIENAAGDVGLQVVFDAPYVEDSLSTVIAATPDFITDVSPASGTLGGGESDDVDITMDAEDIEPGTYEKDLALSSNDPDNMAMGIPATLSVTSGPPAIALEPDSLDFGSVLVGNTATRTFTIDNSGGGPLQVSSVSFPDPYVPVDSSDLGPFAVPFGETRDVEVEFAPSSVSTFPDSIIVESDATNDPTAAVHLQGEGIPAPDIAVSPSAISDSLAPDDSSETMLMVSNNGGSPLEFSTTFSSGGTTAPSEVAASSDAQGSSSADSDALATAGDGYDGARSDVGQTSTTYQVDDGTTENALGFGGQGDDFHSMWLNAFQVVEGSGTITQISTAWGCADSGCSAPVIPEGKEGTALVYNDPNNDGDPADAELLTETDITVEDPGTDNFTSVSIEPTPVEGTFFIAVLLENVDADAFPMPMDESSTYQEASWAVATTLPGSFDKEDLDNNDTLARLDNLGPGFPANWLLRAEGGASFVAVSPNSGTVPAGETDTLTAQFDATGLDPAIYTGSIDFMSNDPDDSPSVDATLEVSAGPAAIALEPDSLDFGSLLVGDDTTGMFTISNTGGEPLEVSTVTFPDQFVPVDSGDTGPFTIPYEGSRDIEVQFDPSEVGTFTGSVTVESNAENMPSASVFVEGEGLPAPELAYSPDSLEATLASGADTSLTLTVSNEGASGSTLNYSFPDFAAEALLAQPGVERNNTSSVIDDASYERSNGDPHAGIGHPVRTGAGGPDAFGYSWIDSNEPGGPSFAFNDISDVGTALELTDDFGANPTALVDVPFGFEFYGQTEDSVRVDHNGFLYFTGPDDDNFSNDEIPTADLPNGIVAPLWEDLNPEAGDGTVYTYHDESAGQFIVQYDEIEAFGGSDPFTFQVILDESGSIRYNYMTIPTNNNDYNSATIGIENQAGDVGLQVVFNEAYAEDSLSVEIAATPDFITDVEPASGAISGGESEDVTVTFDATDVDAGTYETGLALSTNDLDAMSTEVPSMLTVTGGTGDCPLAWSLDVATMDSTGSEETLTLGQGSSATAGLDEACGEVEQPPVPPAPETDFRFVGEGLPGVDLGEGTLVDIRPTDTPTPADNHSAPAIWRMNLQGTYPVSMSWDNGALSNAVDRPIHLVDAATGGDVVSVNMKETGAAEIANSAVTAVEVRFGQMVSHEMTMVDGWNFKSMPVMTSDMSFGAMMGPCHSAFAFTPGEGYDPLAVEDVMAMGDGYWFNCTAASHTVTGSVPSPATAEVGSGWNIVGPYADSVDVNSITSDPEGIVQSAFYGFDHTGGYMAAETLAPGNAYWVKTSEGGVLNLSGDGPSVATLAGKVAASTAQSEQSDVIQLTVSDANGREATLRLAKDLSQQKLQRNALPPKPPSGAFDVRFESGRALASFDADAEDGPALQKLDLQGAAYPLTLRLENAADQSLRLKQGVGPDAETRSLSTENPSVTLQSESGPLQVAPRTIPDEFALESSYPNPVSSQATIEYAVPEKANVTVEVYDVLGRRVATLVNGKKDAGQYSVRVDANSLSSGTYFYRMRAENFTKTRRLVVVR